MHDDFDTNPLTPPLSEPQRAPAPRMAHRDELGGSHITRRGIAGLTAAGAVLAVNALPLPDLLQYLLSPAGLSVIVWALIDWIDQNFTVSGDFKFWLSLGLAFLIPGAAYAAQVALGIVPLDPGGVVGVFGVALGFAQGIHRVREARDRADAAERLAEAERRGTTIGDPQP